MTNTLTTNIIRNVFNIGVNSCDAGQSTCAEGYALYFPCLKDITKGQEACFDFYVADYAGKNAYDLALANSSLNLDDPDSLPDAGKELADLRDVDAISLNLIGAFNCPYGTYSYPDHISSLQTEEYPLMYSLDFGHRTLCHLTLYMLDVEGTGSEIYQNTQESDFYSGTTVELAAYDTPTHIFMGWALLGEEDEECPEETWDDSIVCKDNIYRFVIQNDIIVMALYKPRKMYYVISDPENRSSHFLINYEHIEHRVSNRPEEIFNDDYDVVNKVLEGYHMVAECIPSTDVLGSEPDETYKFVKWKDGNTDRCRLFTVGVDTSAFEESNYILLKAECNGPFPYEDIDDWDILYEDVFDEEGIHILTEFSEIDIYDYYGDGKYVISAEGVYQKFIGEEGYLFFHFGTLELTSLGVEDGIKVNIQAKADDYCELHVTVNDATATIAVSQDEFKMYEIYFNKCNKSNIKIVAYGDCLVDLIEVRKEEIIDKGKARFCLPPEVTENLPSGPLSVNGAIMVNGQTYGLATTQIGNINKLPKITLNL